MNEVLRAVTFKHSNKSFIDVLNEHNIDFNLNAGYPGQIMASGVTIEIIINGGWGVLAVAILAWMNARKSRKINISTKDNKAIWLEGYSAKEAEKILQSAKDISVIDTEPNNEENA